MISDKEMENYIKNAKKIYSQNGQNVIAYVTKYADGSSKVRLYVYSTVEDISAPIEMQNSNLGSDIKKLQDFVYLKDYRDIRKIRMDIATYFYNIPIIRCYKNIGFQRDANGNIISYNGARCYDNSGKEIAKDMFASLPKYHGNVENIIDQLNSYMQKNVKRQIVLLHALSGAVCGLVKRNNILVLVGESSKGKTTAMRMGSSFFGQPDCEKTVLKWSATQNALGRV